MKKLIILLFLSIFLIGCAPKQMLVKDNITQEQANIDAGNCKLEALRITQIDVSRSGYAQFAREADAFNYCMQAKGYRYQTKK